jgi:gluconolactonase
MPEKPEKIAGGYKATAGPVCSRRGYLLFCDVPANRILKWERGQVSVFREKSNGAVSNTFDHQGRLLTCEKGRVTRTEKDGKITVLASGVKEPADVVYAIDGSIYFSDPPAGVVYQIPRQGELRGVARDCERPVGVALAPNQRRFFVADAARGNVRVYEVAGDGALGEGKVFATYEGRPGGLKTDESGALWVAGDAGIRHFDPTGKLVELIALPERAANCNWGEGFRDLYVTAGTSVYRVHAAVNGTRTY